MTLLEYLFQEVREKRMSNRTFEYIVENSEYQHWQEGLYQEDDL